MTNTEISTYSAFVAAGLSHAGFVLYEVKNGAGVLKSLVAPITWVWAWLMMPTEIAKLNVMQTIQGDSISKIEKEITVNGGGSLKDMIMRQEQRQKVIIDDAAFGFFEANASGQFLSVNRAMCALTGRTPEELYGFNWLSWVVPEQRASVMTEWRSCAQDRREFFMNLSMGKPDGTRVPVEIHSHPSPLKDGMITGMCVRELRSTPPPQ